MQTKIGIDLGDAEITVSIVGEGIVSRERSVVALRRTDGSFLGIGGDADRYEAEEGEEVALSRIFREGVIVPEYTRAVIARAIARHASRDTDGAVVLLSVPCSFDEVEEVALTEMTLEAGAREAYLVYSPLAAVVGNSLDPSRSAVIVDIGSARTNILTVCHGRIFYKKTCAAAGAGFDRAIANYLLEKHKVRISRETAEIIKKKIGTVWVGNEKRYLDVRGRDVKNGDYCTARISSEEMFVALEEPMAALIEGVCDAITKIPTDCVQDVFDTGILLAGGGALLDGLDKMISGVTGVDVMRLSAPGETIALGLSGILETHTSLQAAGSPNISRYVMKTASVPQKGMYK